MTSLQVVTVLPALPQVCFDLARDVDAHTRSMAASGERVVGGRTSGLLDLGDEVVFAGRHVGVPFRLHARMTVVDAPHRFVDEQVRGPFARWRHTHLFTPLPDGATEMTDRVDYASPLGPVGRLVDRLGLAAYLERQLEERGAWMLQELQPRT